MLHAFAERVGQNPVVPLQLDEVRELEILVRSFPQTLPCPTCQRHATEYIQAHPLGWAKLRGAAVAPEARRWFYDFHDHVNQHKVSGIAVSPAYELLPTLYGGPLINLAADFEVFAAEVGRAVNFNWVKHEASVKVRRHLTTLRRLMGI